LTEPDSRTESSQQRFPAQTRRYSQGQPRRKTARLEETGQNGQGREITGPPAIGQSGLLGSFETAVAALKNVFDANSANYRKFKCADGAMEISPGLERSDYPGKSSPKTNPFSAPGRRWLKAG
jgi:hypothetical protein